jgi:hypothetical protein
VRETLGIRTIPVLLTAALSFVGCTTDEPPPKTSEAEARLPSDGPCQFLTAEEVEQVADENVINVSRQASHSTQEKILCVYETSGELASVVVYSEEDGLAEFERIAKDELNTEAVDLGDRAVIHGKASVAVLDDGAFLGVSSQHLYDGSDAILVELARIALERL